MTRNIYGIRLFYSALTGLWKICFDNPGRCPGLIYQTPLGLKKIKIRTLHLQLNTKRIKSTNLVTTRHIRTLERFLKDFKNAQGFCFSLDPKPRKIGPVHVVPWNKGFEEIGLSSISVRQSPIADR